MMSRKKARYWRNYRKLRRLFQQWIKATEAYPDAKGLQPWDLFQAIKRELKETGMVIESRL